MSSETIIHYWRMARCGLLALLLAGLLSGCEGLPVFAGFGEAEPLRVGREEFGDEATGRRGSVYRLEPGQALPAGARRWLALPEWEALDRVGKLDAIEAEARRGNVLLLEGGAVHVVPETALARPGRPAPAFRKVTPGQDPN